MTRDEMFAYALPQPGCIRMRNHRIVNEAREPDCLVLALDRETKAQVRARSL